MMGCSPTPHCPASPHPYRRSICQERPYIRQTPTPQDIEGTGKKKKSRSKELLMMVMVTIRVNGAILLHMGMYNWHWNPYQRCEISPR